MILGDEAEAAYEKTGQISKGCEYGCTQVQLVYPGWIRQTIMPANLPVFRPNNLTSAANRRKIYLDSLDRIGGGW
jgi:hypothetical protein